MNKYFRFILMIGVLLALLSLAVPLAASGQQQNEIKVTLTPYEGNPIFTPDTALAWEAGGVGRQRIVSYNGLIYMFYQGYTKNQTAGSVGYATSQDGLHWTKYKDNPVFVPDKTVAPQGVMNLAVILNGTTWTLYFTPWPSGKAWFEFSGDILVATAPAPTGPWVAAAEPAITESSIRDWDFGGRYLMTVTRSKNGYTMFYDAGNITKTGMATSTDSLHWTKYNDPATTSRPYADCDPVFAANPDPKAWDRGFISGPVVRLTDKGWEMFYSGGEDLATTRSIGYATSLDGIQWTRLGDAPLLSDPNKLLSPETVVEVNGQHYLYYVILSKSWQPEGIGVATISYE